MDSRNSFGIPKRCQLSKTCTDLLSQGEWLLSGDDGENSFIKRLKEELGENRKNPELIEPQLKKCPLCKNFNGTACKHRFDLSYRYVDNPEWEEIDRKSYEKRLLEF